MYVQTHACAYACVCACMHVFMHVCMHVWMYACMDVCMYLCASMFANTHACMYVCAHICVQVCTSVLQFKKWMRKDMVVCQQTCMCVKECMHVKHEIRHAHILYKNMHVCENTCVCNRCTPVVTCMYVNAFWFFNKQIIYQWANRPVKCTRGNTKIIHVLSITAGIFRDWSILHKKMVRSPNPNR